MCGLFGGSKTQSDDTGQKESSLRHRAWSWAKQNVVDAVGDNEKKESSNHPSNTDHGQAVIHQNWRGHELCFDVSLEPSSATCIVQVYC